MNRPATIVLGLCSLCCAQGILVLGLWLFLDVFGAGEGVVVSLALVAMGSLLAMRLVIDGLVPDAGRVFTGALKLIALAVFLTCGTIAFCSSFAGQYDLP